MCSCFTIIVINYIIVLLKIVYIILFFCLLFLYPSDSVLDNDLSTWEEGIRRSDFDAAIDRGTHYQIINHKLYRQTECMFPFRLVPTSYISQN